ncbi:MAG: galactose-1-phosphate uridylyltransferase [Desulfonatronovibrio sp.]
MKSKFRQNKLSGEWVIFAPSRRKRPMDFVREVCEVDIPAYDPDCPFCPGNEAKLSRIIHEIKDPDKEVWSARAVYNKYPALTTEGEDVRSENGIYLEGNGFGLHMVILESPRHDLQMYNMTRQELQAVVDMYHYCYTLVSEDPRVTLIKLFKNYGRTAGASLHHPHSQLVASCIVPKFIREKENQEQRYFDEKGRCVMCDVLDFELKDRQRVIFENQRFAVFVPFAAEVPFELWVVPRKHAADFKDISEAEKRDMAESLELVMKVLREKLGSPEYNFAVNSCSRYKSNEPHLHWYLRVVPRLTTRAGFEIGSGMCINPSLPEADAQFLRG